MPPPALPSSRPGYSNGSSKTPPDLGSRPSSALPPTPQKPNGGGGLGLLMMFLGAFAAVFLLAIIGAVVYFVALHSSSTSSSKPKNQLQNVAAWQLGSEAAKPLDGSEKTDIGWWAKTFDLPKTEDVSAYLQKQGLNVASIEPSHYEETKDTVTVTYQVHAEVPNQLLRLRQVPWHPTDPVQARYSPILILNQGLPAGSMWDTQHPAVAAEAGTKLNFAWQAHWDKTFNHVTTDRLPYSDNVFTQQQVDQYRQEAANTTSTLAADIKQIDDQIQSDLQAQLAQVPANPPKPELRSRKWGGDGSGEPTKSAERIGGGTAAGAAGGAAFGAAAGDAGMGAGIGAGVGLLGGIIYDTVSKDNDKKKYQREVDAENDAKMADWRTQVKALDQQRAQIKKDAAAQKEKDLTDLANRITAANGRVDTSGTPAPMDNAPAVAPSTIPSADQPSGPIRQP